jgi:NTP pyrophosphatase (non-canonical NTP hydrolase)
MTDRTWEQVDRLMEWLDEKAETSGPADVRLLRVLKIGEEFGEVAEALHGAMGANPRKGRSHTWNDVQKELADVIVTAMVALATVAPDARHVLQERLDVLVRRVLPEEEPSG